MTIYVSTANAAQANLPATNAGNSFAQLITSETAAEVGSGVSGTVTPALPLLPKTTSAGGFDIAPVSVTSGSGTAVWEIAKTQPNTNENFDFGVFVAYTANTNNGLPQVGQTMTVTLSYAPTSSTGGVASASLPIPRFAPSGSAINVFLINICQTALLFPYVTNIGGFDTGLAIANTTVDPFSTGGQSGTCAINWFNTVAATGVTSTLTPGKLGKTGYGDATAMGAGEMQTILVSLAQPGFNGYVIAVCDYQYAHGFAFVSDLGSQKLAMGYLALVMVNGGIPVRGIAAETLTY